jgi:L-cysteine/cystine lyase
MDPAALRASFPVFAQRAYLNAGTCGPLPASAVRAAIEALEQAAHEGRTGPYFEGLPELRARVRDAYAQILGAAPGDVALTTSTSEGIVRVLGALALGQGDEVLTSTEEHPGLLGPLVAARAQRGVTIRAVPFEELADAVTPATRLVASSHFSWVSGRFAPDLAGIDAPVLLDGAQGVGAVPVDVGALGCAFYAGSGQKWLCGPIGTGMLWVSPTWSERLPATGPTHVNLVDPNAGLDLEPHAGAARHDAAAQSPETMRAAAAALDALEDAGWDAIHHRAAALAATLAQALADRGLQVRPRDRTTLVSWHDPDALATRERLADAGVIVRDLPGRDLLRASVGAWNDESDLDRLLAAL